MKRISRSTAPEDFVWTVSPYADALRQRKRKDVGDGRSRFHPASIVYHVFETEESANAFIMERAAKALVCARDSVVAAERRVAKCEKKYGPQETT